MYHHYSLFFFFLKEPESFGQSTSFLCTPLSGQASMKESVMGTERDREKDSEREIRVFACISNLTVTRMFQVLFKERASLVPLKSFPLSSLKKTTAPTDKK